MYKRFCISVLMVLSLAACTKEAAPLLTEVQFRATISPEILTQAGDTKAGDAEAVVADHAVLQAWRGGILAADVEQTITPGTTQICFNGVKLAAGVDYDIYIWVDSKDYYNTSDLRIVSLSEGKSYDGRSQEFEAFYVYTDVRCSQAGEVCPVSLKRPFARLNFNAQTTSVVKIQFAAPTSLNLSTGEVIGSRMHSYTAAQGTDGVSAFDYVFAPEGVTQMNYSFKIGEADITNTTVPVSRNTKTNIIYNTTN